MANPQKEKGHTQIANEILEALARTNIGGKKRQILDFIIRKTYGFNKKQDKISLSQFREGTGLEHREVCRCLLKLQVMKIIIKIEDDQGNIYGLNKDYDQWTKLTCVKNATGKKVSKPSDKNVPNPVTKMTHTKDNIQKTITKESTPAQKSREFFKNQEPIITALIARGAKEDFVRREISKFVSYWTEPNKSGTKVLWELKPTFDVPRRLATWFNRIKENKKPKITVHE